MQNTEVAAWSIQAALELPSCIPVPLDLCGSRLMDRATCCPHGAVLCFHNIFGSTIGNMCIALKRLPKNFKRGKKKEFPNVLEILNYSQEGKPKQTISPSLNTSNPSLIQTATDTVITFCQQLSFVDQKEGLCCFHKFLPPLYIACLGYSTSCWMLPSLKGTDAYRKGFCIKMLLH